jgi:hypothetical protein
MSVIKQNLINLDHADKKWLSEDYDQHWTEPETQAADKTLNYFLMIIALLLTVIVTIAVRGL